MMLDTNGAEVILEAGALYYGAGQPTSLQDSSVSLVHQCPDQNPTPAVLN